jgi:hypothetical protein
MTKQPCTACGQRIGRNEAQYVVGDVDVVCVNCAAPSTVSEDDV